MPQVAVMVNVYDLSEVNEYARPLGIGIFHSGLVVHGREFSFGGHDYASSGIFETAPKAAPAPAIFREEVYVGTTEMNPGEVSNLVGEMDDDFHGNTYHLLERNCNHFVEALCFELTGKMPPGFINRLARTAVVANSCAPCILPVSIRAVADTPSVPPPPSAAQYTMKTGVGGACSEGTGAGSTGSPTRRTRTTTPRCCRACRRRTGRRCGGTGAGTASVDVL
jgi:hypothetical protein